MLFSNELSVKAKWRIKGVIRQRTTLYSLLQLHVESDSIYKNEYEYEYKLIQDQHHIHNFIFHILETPFGSSKVKINRGFHQFPPHVGKGKFLFYPTKNSSSFRSNVFLAFLMLQLPFIQMQYCCMIMRINVDCNSCCRKLRRIILRMKGKWLKWML